VHCNAVRETQFSAKEFAIFGKKGQPVPSPPEMAAAMPPVHRDAVKETHFAAESVFRFWQQAISRCTSPAWQSGAIATTFSSHALCDAADNLTLLLQLPPVKYC